MTARPDSRSRSLPDFALETAALDGGHWTVAGIDEAGRGPWAGPVLAAAVVLDPDNIPGGLNDSKKLTAQVRDTLFERISAMAHVGIGIAGVDRIDRDNILGATLWAMRAALDDLPSAPAYALVDGNRMPDLPCPAETVIRGDARCLSIAAASIIAKAARDRIMRNLSEQYPGYGWERNMGYGTAEHSAAIGRLGVTPHHRRSFRPVRLRWDCPVDPADDARKTAGTTHR